MAVPAMSSTGIPVRGPKDLPVSAWGVLPLSATAGTAVGLMGETPMPQQTAQSSAQP